MAGSIAILLFIIVLLVVGGIGLALYAAGGVHGWSDADRREDRAEQTQTG